MNSRNSVQKVRDWSYVGTRLSNPTSPGVSDARDNICFEALRRVSYSNGALHLVGVGNPMRNDDGVGLRIIRELAKRYPATSNHFVIHSPNKRAESTISAIDYEKDKALIVDAVEFNSRPGSIVFTTLSDSRYGFFATHNIPLKSIPSVSSHLDRIFVLGIQPLNIQVGERLSRPVQESMEQTVEELSKIMCEES